MLPRNDSALVLGSRLWIAPFSSSINASALPDPPSSASAGLWLTLGKIKTFKPQIDYKTADLEGVDDTGVYVTTESKIATKRKLIFTTSDIAPEALQLTFGLIDTIADGTSQAIFGSSNGTIACWVYIELSDAYRDGASMANFAVQGKLTLTNPIEAKSDPAEAAYELSVVSNALAQFTPININSAPDPV